MQKGQGLIEYILIFILLAIVVIAVMALLFSNPLSTCDYREPTAGQIVDCIATRTAEARHQ